MFSTSSTGGLRRTAVATHAEHSTVISVVERLLPLLDVPLVVTTSNRVSDP
jgi:hypothetical protein